MVREDPAGAQHTFFQAGPFPTQHSFPRQLASLLIPKSYWKYSFI